MWIKKLCKRKVRDFALALWTRKVSGAFEKRAPGFKPMTFAVPVQCSTNSLKLTCIIQNDCRIVENVHWVKYQWRLTYVYQIIRRDGEISAKVPRELKSESLNCLSLNLIVPSAELDRAGLTIDSITGRPVKFCGTLHQFYVDTSLKAVEDQRASNRVHSVTCSYGATSSAPNPIFFFAKTNLVFEILLR